MQQALPAVSCHESALTEEALLTQQEDFANTTWVWIKVMPGRYTGYPVYVERD